MDRERFIAVAFDLLTAVFFIQVIFSSPPLDARLARQCAGILLLEIWIFPLLILAIARVHGKETGFHSRDANPQMGLAMLAVACVLVAGVFDIWLGAYVLISIFVKYKQIFETKDMRSEGNRVFFAMVIGGLGLFAGLLLSLYIWGAKSSPFGLWGLIYFVGMAVVDFYTPIAPLEKMFSKPPSQLDKAV
jgi:hypothetical protein